MNDYFFIRVKEIISDERWYKPSQVFMVILYDEYSGSYYEEDIKRYDIVQSRFNDRIIIQSRPDLIKRYRDNEISVAYDDAYKIQDPVDFMNHDFIEFLKLGSDLNASNRQN